VKTVSPLEQWTFYLFTVKKDLKEGNIDHPNLRDTASTNRNTWKLIYSTHNLPWDLAKVNYFLPIYLVKG